jgi:LysM repeat protein
MGMRFESDHQEEDLSTYDAYTALDERKTGGKVVYYYVAAGLGILILVLVIVMMGNGAGRQETASRMGLIEKRLDDLEFRLGNLVQDTTAESDLGVLQQANEDLSRRFDSLEKKLEGRLNQINAALVKLEKQRSTPPPKPKTPPAAPKKKAPVKAKTQQHTVQKGDTLYKISRKYGMSVDGLRKLNGIGPDSKIYPGQKLKVAGKP